MYAVVKTGGKQYRVAKNDVIVVEKLAGDQGAVLQLNDVLMISDDQGTTVGTPTVSGAAITAEVLEQGRGDKIIVFKKKRRKNYRRTRGHQQPQTVLRVTDILRDGSKAVTRAAEPKPAAAEAATDAAPAAESAPKPASKAPAKKAAAKKSAAKKTAAKKTAKKAPAKKAAAKKKAAKKTEE
jgi:large subunit ribosomal protein L21